MMRKTHFQDVSQAVYLEWCNPAGLETVGHIIVCSALVLLTNAFSSLSLFVFVGFALFAMSITVFLNALILILSIVKFAIFDCMWSHLDILTWKRRDLRRVLVISFSFSTLFCGVLAAAIHYLWVSFKLKLEDDTQSHQFLTQTQIQ